MGDTQETSAARAESRSYELREGLAEDASYIFSSWLGNFRDAKAVGGVPDTLFFANHRRLLVDLLSRSVVTVACNPSNPREIYGYIVYDPQPRTQVIHWVCVKRAHQGKGIASALYASATSDAEGKALHYTHKGPAFYGPSRDSRGRFLDVTKRRGLVYNPYWLHFPLDADLVVG